MWKKILIESTSWMRKKIDAKMESIDLTYFNRTEDSEVFVAKERLTTNRLAALISRKKELHPGEK